MQPAPGPHSGSALDQEHSELSDVVNNHVFIAVVANVPVVVVHRPEEGVPQGDVLVLQVGAVYHKLTSDPLATLLILSNLNLLNYRFWLLAIELSRLKFVKS